MDRPGSTASVAEWSRGLGWTSEHRRLNDLFVGRSVEELRGGDWNEWHHDQFGDNGSGDGWSVEWPAVDRGIVLGRSVCCVGRERESGKLHFYKVYNRIYIDTSSDCRVWPVACIGHLCTSRV